MKVVLVKRDDPRSDPDLEERRLREFQGLADSAGHKIVGTVVQERYSDPTYQVGSGKIKEVADLVSETGAEKTIFYNKLGAVQMHNIALELGVEAIDRFHLILEIFAQRAHSKKAQVQVEMARLRYELPKAKTMVSISKQSERPGFMGLGRYEDKYEQDLRDRISRLQDELDTIEQRGETRRQRRRERGFDLVALAGYTNAGKSTLLNQLVDESVEAQDRLFTTLSPTTRGMEVNGRRVLLTDTVGFIDNLPHWLVEAFKSTLEEIFLADLILLVVDVSQPPEEMRRKLTTSHDVLWENAREVPVVTVLNKADQIDKNELREKLEEIEYLVPEPIVISAREGWGLQELRREIHDHLPEWRDMRISLPQSSEGMSTLSWLYENAQVLEVNYNQTIDVRFRGREEILRRAREAAITS